MKRSVSYDVTLNIYDLSQANDYLYPMGFGIHHSGVEVMGSEYTFAGGGGIFSHSPREAPGALFRCSIKMGTITNRATLERALSDLRPEFLPNSYNVLNRNCNTFSDAFCLALLDKPIPGYVNRVANLGNAFSCLFPPQMIGNAPVNEDRSFAASNNVYEPFSGSGMSLADSDSKITSSSTINSTANLTDRREKIRLARISA
eukprot:CAMPEP_0171452942 /NCGR_PEP_ID=MMETSP0945-20130129/853_1 /TAXON_ID=109269 /ORGANISM="Vaucheria litorea, Strain CCMP2940" /LENGTH=201 /DNA_ID=CAMNT_0011977719 /DNA_START=97 /DNA_END=699 /DNA_ORIENTATION=+